jgi:branched-chain amino acid aminotransferase
MDNAWVPRKPGSSLYIRPFMYASETRFGVKVSEQYKFVVFTGPVPELFQRPIKVKVETEYIRAAKGGTGYAKCGGNYGASYYPTQIAKKQGYDQILWTDGRDHAFIEESGMMNAMFVINDTIVTPPVSDSILDGITRESLLILANDMGIACEERPVSVAELEKGIRDGSVTEAFGAGTAAVVAPIELIHIGGTDYHLPPYHSESRMNQLKQRLDEIRSGKAEDVYNWNYVC